jgi:hypothetical protein
VFILPPPAPKLDTTVMVLPVKSSSACAAEVRRDEEDGEAKRAFGHHARSCSRHSSHTYSRASRLCQIRVTSSVLCSWRNL